MPVGLGYKSISELYTEVHTVSHTQTRLKGDNNVYQAFNSAIERESHFTRKKSTVVESETRFQTALSTCTAMNDIPNFTGDNAATLKTHLTRV